ncbi:tagaturonate epimerase [Abditibacterium utsteinense]|uniref:Tagaturonate/fructuronate epimerase n=1 Tax=Abditibacterium utsteinense TaxID=1960156 RepID=A0A2S8SRZ4_9BACT|nr:tagaturonate epimerase family protein [Abditibacterium utsteinense]PQV63546.1 tagaturonate epimerase [Abditibacterium utsteinense]
MTLEKFSFGVGDRFAHQAAAQLRAFQMLAARGVVVTPVWNKSHREHTTIGSTPPGVLAAAKAAVTDANWKGGFHIDADHIRRDTVADFLLTSDFYTLDVAASIGQNAPPEAIADFTKNHPELAGKLTIPGIDAPLEISCAEVERIAGKYWLAAREAGQLYRDIAAHKGAENFITEVSMDETDAPQTPPELLIILALLADEKIPLQTIAPKFSGRFNKGVDYQGDIASFEREFNDDLAVIAFATKNHGLPANLKLSVHSGSDKFSIYAPIRRAICQFDAGLHLKTAGTTWLEEVIGLAEAGGNGLEIAKSIYAQALAKKEALCAPYATVIEVKEHKLPAAETVQAWSSEQFVAALRHDPQNPDFNASLRQLIHVGYKIAAQMGALYLDALDENRAIVAKNVTHNLFERHLKPIFLGE